MAPRFLIFSTDTPAALDVLAENVGGEIIGVGNRAGALTLRFGSGDRVAISLSDQDRLALLEALGPRFYPLTFDAFDLDSATLTLGTRDGVRTIHCLAAKVVDQIL